MRAFLTISYDPDEACLTFDLIPATDKDHAVKRWAEVRGDDGELMDVFSREEIQGFLANMDTPIDDLEKDWQETVREYVDGEWDQ